MKKTVIIIIVGLLALGCSSAYKTLTAQMPDLKQINDGVYRGFYDLSGTPVKATVDVTIQNNRIIKIEIIDHTCSPVGKKAEGIIEQVVEKQNLEIDAVSGATASSKTLLKAVENALR